MDEKERRALENLMLSVATQTAALATFRQILAAIAARYPIDFAPIWAKLEDLEPPGLQALAMGTMNDFLADVGRFRQPD